MYWYRLLRFTVVVLLGYAADHSFWLYHRVHPGHEGLFMMISVVLVTEHFAPTRKNFITAAIIILLSAVSAPYLFGE